MSDRRCVVVPFYGGDEYLSQAERYLRVAPLYAEGLTVAVDGQEGTVYLLTEEVDFLTPSDLDQYEDHVVSLLLQNGFWVERLDCRGRYNWLDTYEGGEVTVVRGR